MGQYHKTVCIEAEEGLIPYALAGGLKEGVSTDIRNWTLLDIENWIPV